MLGGSTVALLLLSVTPYRHTLEILWVHFPDTTSHANVWFPKLCFCATVV